MPKKLNIVKAAKTAMMCQASAQHFDSKPPTWSGLGRLVKGSSTFVSPAKSVKWELAQIKA